jgi:hypothetical protein
MRQRRVIHRGLSSRPGGVGEQPIELVHGVLLRQNNGVSPAARRVGRVSADVQRQGYNHPSEPRALTPCAVLVVAAR